MHKQEQYHKGFWLRIAEIRGSLASRRRAFRKWASLPRCSYNEKKQVFSVYQFSYYRLLKLFLWKWRRFKDRRMSLKHRTENLNNARIVSTSDSNGYLSLKGTHRTIVVENRCLSKEKDNNLVSDTYVTDTNLEVCFSSETCMTALNVSLKKRSIVKLKKYVARRVLRCEQYRISRRHLYLARLKRSFDAFFWNCKFSREHYLRTLKHKMFRKLCRNCDFFSQESEIAREHYHKYLKSYSMETLKKFVSRILIRSRDARRRLEKIIASCDSKHGKD